MPMDGNLGSQMFSSYFKDSSKMASPENHCLNLQIDIK
jgi:hypothetical protein